MLTIARRASGPSAATSPPPPPPPTVLLRDNFTGADGTELAAHTMDVGPGWTQISADIQLSGNAAVPTTITSPMYTSDSGKSDITASCTVVPVSAAGLVMAPALVFRFSDANNNWRVDLIVGSNQCRLIKIVAGALTVVATATVTVTSGVAHALKIACSGSSISVFVDTVLLISVSDSFNFTATICGLSLDTNAISLIPGSSWDSLLVTNP